MICLNTITIMCSPSFLIVTIAFFTVSGIMYALIKNATAHSAAIDFLFKLLTRFDRFTEIVEVKIGGEASVKSVIEKYVPIHINRYHRNLLASIGVARQFDIDIVTPFFS